jgi:hypothetical protein
VAVALESDADGVRQRLRAVFETDPAGAVVLTPSGTDAVFMMSALTLARGAERVHHVVVGAGELGSGTLGAAQGEAFTDHRPVGDIDVLGRGLAGLSDRCTAEPVYLRSPPGALLDPDGVDDAVVEATETAIAAGATVVVHLVAHSKTGLRAPTIDCVEGLIDRHGDRVRVLVDAAQGRVAPVDIRRALEREYVVLFTGSKFYSGPPFSGALLLPPAWSDDPGSLPVGLHEWLSAADLPSTWTVARATLPVAANPGLLLRWEAALAEIEAYHAIPPDRRSGVYHTFAAALMAAFGPVTPVELIVPTPPVHQLASGLGSFPSVFSIVVRDGDGRRLGMDELRRFHADLDTVLESDRPALRRRFHLGQPVALGPPREDPTAVLRIALGARLVRERADDPDAGAEWFRRTATELLEKITALLSGEVGAAA